MWFKNSFSHSVGYIFILFMVSFAVKILSSLMWSLLFFICCFCFWCQIKKKKIIAKTDVKEFTAYIFFYEFYDFRYYSQVFDPLWIEATSFLNVSVIPKNGQNKRRRVSLIHYHHWKRVTSYILPKIHDCLSKTLK